jgi:carbon monoxide dehydrogenase subunit G
LFYFGSFAYEFNEITSFFNKLNKVFFARVSGPTGLPADNYEQEGKSMEMTGEYRIPADRETVWAALNDPDVLAAAIPGCDELEKTSDTGFAATVTAKVGPVKAKFKGEVTLSDIDAPNGYTISGEGKGGAAGFAKGGAKVKLEADGGETILRYEVNANVGGKLAQIGSRLIDGTARKLADEFFQNFSDQVGQRAAAAAPAETPRPEPEGHPAAATEVPAAVVEEAFETGDASPEMLHVRADRSEHAGAPPHAEPEKKSGGLPTWIWVGGLIVIIAIILLVYAG